MTDVTIMLPEGLENMQLPSHELVTFYKDLEDRIIYLEEEITPSVLEISKQIMRWNIEDKGKSQDLRKPIKLMFFSPGGDLDSSNALIDVIKISTTPVWGFNLGQCASGAAFIYLSCHKRFMTPRSYFLFHQGSGSFSGTFQEVCSQLEDYQYQVDQLVNFMKKNTDYTEEEVANNIGGEWYIYAEEALKKGVCDEIIQNLDKIM